MDNIREFTELLKGCSPIKDRKNNIVVQSILNMQLICLTTADEYSLDDRFANPLDSLQASNKSYGEIVLKNTTNKEVIAPNNVAILTEQKAQNHGMVKSGYIGAGNTTTFHDAGCVQGSEGGHFRGTQEFRILPVTMREMLFDKVGQTEGYQNIYPAIRKLGQDTDSNTGDYIDKYFTKYDKKLEQFIAHFERPDKLIGTIVLIDGEIIAIDKFPSFTYAEQVWDLMIRDCYGALAIISELKNKSGDKLFTEIFENLSKRDRQDNIVDLIESALNKTKETIGQGVQNKIQELMELTFESELDTEGNPSPRMNIPTSHILKNEGYIGQVIGESEFNHMVSIVKKESFDPNALRAVNELRTKARSQDRFTM
jgi:ARG and Rhodanese-Phosphatase-superfamily-associated Protein domain